MSDFKRQSVRREAAAGTEVHQSGGWKAAVLVHRNAARLGVSIAPQPRALTLFESS